jgi:hypothetical protein
MEDEHKPHSSNPSFPQKRSEPYLLMLVEYVWKNSAIREKRKET